MKKFISMLVGVVATSSLFLASAYAENVTATPDKTEVNVGETIVVRIDSAQKKLSADSFRIEYDTNILEVVDIVDIDGCSVTAPTDESDPAYDENLVAWFRIAAKSGKTTSDIDYMASTLENAKKEKSVSFANTNAKEVTYQLTESFATITFKALAEGETALTLIEDSAGGEDAFSGTLDTIAITVKADEPPVDNNNYGTAGNEFEGKATKYWTVNYEAGAFTGTDVITLKEKDSDKTATINVTTTDDFDIAGAVSFYVYVIGNDIANVYIVE